MMNDWAFNFTISVHKIREYVLLSIFVHKSIITTTIMRHVMKQQIKLHYFTWWQLGCCVGHLKTVYWIFDLISSTVLCRYFHIVNMMKAIRFQQAGKEAAKQWGKLLQTTCWGASHRSTGLLVRYDSIVFRYERVHLQARMGRSSPPCPALVQQKSIRT